MRTLGSICDTTSTLYVTKRNSVFPDDAATVQGKLTICDLHWVLGNVLQLVIKSAVERDLIEGVEFDSASKPEFCDVCEKGKATCQPFPKESKRWATAYGEFIHTDLWGPRRQLASGDLPTTWASSTTTPANELSLTKTTTFVMMSLDKNFQKCPCFSLGKLDFAIIATSSN